MKKRVQIYFLVALLVVLAYVLATSRGAGPGANGVLASDASFVPLNVEEPELRLDLLAQFQRRGASASALAGKRECKTKASVPHGTDTSAAAPGSGARHFVRLRADER